MTIITSKTNVDFDPGSIAEEPMDLDQAIRDMDAVSIADEQKEASYEPTFLRFSVDGAKVYYFKCKLLSMKIRSHSKEISIASSQSHLLKLFYYWQTNSSRVSTGQYKEHSYSSGSFKAFKERRKKSYDENASKVQLTRMYTIINGAKRGLLELISHDITEISYNFNDGKPSLTISF